MRQIFFRFISFLFNRSLFSYIVFPQMFSSLLFPVFLPSFQSSFLLIADLVFINFERNARSHLLFALFKYSAFICCLASVFKWMSEYKGNYFAIRKQNLEIRRYFITGAFLFIISSTYKICRLFFQSNLELNSFMCNDRVETNLDTKEKLLFCLNLLLVLMQTTGNWISIILIWNGQL